MQPCCIFVVYSPPDHRAVYRLNKYLVAVFLMLVFTQGISMRLWMHQWFHENTSKSSTLTASDEVKIKCDCLQDAGMPLQHVSSFELTIPSEVYCQIFGAHSLSFSSLDKVFCSLKGPPHPMFVIIG